jgi:hypothetical protein
MFLAVISMAGMTDDDDSECRSTIPTQFGGMNMDITAFTKTVVVEIVFIDSSA